MCKYHWALAGAAHYLHKRLWAADEGLLIVGKPCISQGKASLASSGQTCCCSKTADCTAPSGNPKITWDLIHTREEAGYMYVRTHHPLPTHTHSYHTPTLDCLYFLKKPPQLEALLQLRLIPVICCRNNVSSQPGPALPRKGNREEGSHFHPLHPCAQHSPSFSAGGTGLRHLPRGLPPD